MPPPPDELEQRVRMVTRSGRAVRPPDRYEPDPNEILEDDYSDVLSDSESGEGEWGYGDPPQTEDEGVQDSTDSEEGDFTNTESRDSSYESASATSSSEDEDGDTDYSTNTDPPDSEPCEDDQQYIDDILEWDTLTADASDSYLSEDDLDM
jgi:hypothetical protein